MNENLNNGNDPNNRNINGHDEEDEDQNLDEGVEVIEVNDADLDEGG